MSRLKIGQEKEDAEIVEIKTYAAALVLLDKLLPRLAPPARTAYIEKNK